MNFEDLESAFQGRVAQPVNVAGIEPKKFFVYILAINGRAIVVGHGKKNRAEVIFDSAGHITPGHIKALIVRLYTLFGQGSPEFSRFLIRCENKEEAKKTERQIHIKFGGNFLAVPDDIQTRLFDGIEEHSPAWMVLKMAMCSSFDGLSDLKKWRREGILNDDVWRVVEEKLQLNLISKTSRRRQY
jgi:hypothetical protein